MADKDPSAPKAAPKQSTPDAEEQAELSRQAEHSTYKEVDPETDVRPAPGRQVEQERGKPSES
jgi:hypothetical protein